MGEMTADQESICLGPGPDPLAVAAGWPADEPLAALLSARAGAPEARWSILAAPSGVRALYRDPDRDRDALLRELDRFAPRPDRAAAPDPDTPPFAGGRLMALTYELGRTLEPRAGASPRDEGEGAIAHLLDCPSALVHDGVNDVWWQVGRPDRGTEPRERLARAVRPEAGEIRSEPLAAEPEDGAYARLVERAIEYIHAGDIFQANVTRRYRSRLELGGPDRVRAFAAALLSRSGALYGSIIDLGDRPGDRTAISLSPELFLDIDRTSGVIRTRPIKGTLPEGADPAELLASEKDAAELTMIVDLMRNDLGRICRLGTVRVTQPRRIEAHPGVLHGVAEVSGSLRESTGFGEILAATFPAGSITGAPKIRAMQVIEELETEPRGLYCGAIGFSSNCGRTVLDVSIRTLDLRRLPVEAPAGATHEVTYGSGCGIVADSDPEGEVAESHAKAALLAGFLAERNAGAIGTEARA